MVLLWQCVCIISNSADDIRKNGSLANCAFLLACSSPCHTLNVATELWIVLCTTLRNRLSPWAKKKSFQYLLIAPKLPLFPSSWPLPSYQGYGDGAAHGQRQDTPLSELITEPCQSTLGFGTLPRGTSALPWGCPELLSWEFSVQRLYQIKSSLFIWRPLWSRFSLGALQNPRPWPPTSNSG